MPEESKKERKRVVVEEVSTSSEPEPESESKMEVPAKTEPHIEPGIHEVPKPKVADQPTKPIITDTPLPNAAPPRSGLNPLVIIIPGVFLLGALLGGIIYYQKNITTPPVPEPKTTPIPIVASPTPTTAGKEADLTKYQIKVLNGSGTAGEAGKAQSLLEDAGFKVSATGNASNFSYTKTVIQIEKDVEESFVTGLSKALSESYEVDTKTQTLAESSSDSVVVIVGSTKK